MANETQEDQKDDLLVLRWHFDMIEAIIKDHADRQAVWNFMLTEIKRLHDTYPAPTKKENK